MINVSDVLRGMAESPVIASIVDELSRNGPKRSLGRQGQLPDSLSV